MRKHILSLVVSSVFWGTAYGQCKIDYSKYRVIFDENFSEYSLDKNTQQTQLRNNSPWIFSDGTIYGTSTWPTDVHNPQQISIVLDASGAKICRLTATPNSPSHITSDPDHVKYTSGLLKLNWGDPCASPAVPAGTGVPPSDWSTECHWCGGQGFLYGMMEIVCKKPAGDPGRYDTWPTFWGIGEFNELDIIDDAGNIDPSKKWHSGYIDWGMKPWDHQPLNPWSSIWTYTGPSTPADVATSESFASSLCSGCSDYDPDLMYPSGTLVRLHNPARVYKATRTVYPPQFGHKREVTWTGFNLGDRYNKYTVAWTPTKMTYFLNGREIYTRVFDPYASRMLCPISVMASLQIQTGVWNFWQELLYMNFPTIFPAPKFQMDIKRITLYKGNDGPYTSYKSENEYLNYLSTTTGSAIPSNSVSPGHGTTTVDMANNIFYYVSNDEIIPGIPSRHLCSINPGVTTTRVPLGYNVSGTWADKQPWGDIAYNQTYGIIVYKDRANYIRYLYQASPGYWEHGDFLGYGSSDLVLPGAITGCIKVAGNGDIVYQGQDNKIHRLYKSGGTWHHELNFSTYYSPSELVKGDLCVGATCENVYYKAVNGEMLDIWSPPGYHYIEHLSTDPNWRVADASGSMDLDRNNGRIFFVRKSNNHMSYFYWNTTLGTFVPTEVPSVTYSSSDLPHHDISWDQKSGVFFSAQNSRVTHIYFDGSAWKRETIDDYYETDDFFTASSFRNPNILCSQPLSSQYKYPFISYTDQDGKMRFFEYCKCEQAFLATQVPTSSDHFDHGPLYRHAIDTSNDERIREEIYNMVRFAGVLDENDISDSSAVVSDKSIDNYSTTVYPTVGGGLVNINTNLNSSFYVSVYNLQGSKVFEQNCVNPTEAIDISNQPPGMYILCISADNYNYKTKIIIQK